MVGIHPIWIAGTVFFGFVIMVAFAALIVLVARSATVPPRHVPPPMPYPPTAPPPSAPPAARETPLDILARRFASGEITAEEYQRARDLLQGGPPGP